MEEDKLKADEEERAREAKKEAEKARVAAELRKQMEERNRRDAASGVSEYVTNYSCWRRRACGCLRGTSGVVSGLRSGAHGGCCTDHGKSIAMHCGNLDTYVRGPDAVFRPFADDISVEIVMNRGVLKKLEETKQQLAQAVGAKARTRATAVSSRI